MRQSEKGMMKIFWRISAVMFCVLATSTFETECMANNAATAGRIKVYYVATTGNDLHSGSVNSPWATLQHAADMAMAGTLIRVAPGVYADPIVSTHSGTAQAPIQFVSTTPHGAVIHLSANPPAQFIWENSGNFVTIQGFEIIGTDFARIGIYNHGSHVSAIGNKIHDMNDVTCSSDGGAAILMGPGTTNNNVIGNLIYRIGLGSCTGAPYFHAVYISDQGGVVQNNIIYGNRGRGVNMNHGARNKTISNNLIFDSNAGIEVADWDSTIPADGFIVTNNIIMYTTGYPIQEGGTTGANRYVNNLLYKNYADVLDIYATSAQSGTRVGDPGMVNFKLAGTGDYHLASGSVCINNGTTLGAPTTDFDNLARNDGKPDIGPYEKH